MKWWRDRKRWTDFRVMCALCAVLGPVPALSQSIMSSGESLAEVTVLAGREEADGARLAGLALDIAPGWKTYWRDPGGVGIPPRFDWSRSRNLGSVEILWPRPSIFESFGLMTVGYSGRVVLPLRLVPEQQSRPIELELDLVLGICREVCVLQESAVQARIEPGAPEAYAALVAIAEAAVPRSGWEQGMTAATCRISGAGTKRRFEAALDFARVLEDPVVILEGPELAWFTGVETTAGPAGRLNVEAELSLLDESVWVDRSQIRMTVLAGDFAADIQGCTAPAG